MPILGIICLLVEMSVRVPKVVKRSEGEAPRTGFRHEDLLLDQKMIIISSLILCYILLNI